MTMPMKGSSTISLDGIVYRWKVGKHSSSRLSASDRVIVEAADSKGAPLIVVLDIFWCDDPDVIPSKVAEWIRRAIAAGWQPEKRGGSFTLPLGPLPPPSSQEGNWRQSVVDDSIVRVGECFSAQKKPQPFDRSRLSSVPPQGFEPWTY
jgi:hypothetical protein